MAEIICIYDAQGNKICYDNHPNTGTATKFHLVHTKLGKKGTKVTLRQPRDLPDHPTSIDKLELLVAAAREQGFTNWERITHCMSEY